MGRERIMEEPRRVTITIDRYLYDVAMEWIKEGLHTSFSEVVRTALNHYGDELEEYTALMREDNKAKRDDRNSVIGYDINGNAIVLPHYKVDKMTKKSIEEFIDRHNDMLDPEFWK